MRNLTIVIPVLNEVNAILKVIREIREEYMCPVLVINGWSTNGTFEVLKDLEKQYNIQVICQRTPRGGKGDALKTALDYIKTPYFVVMDGDYSYLPKDLQKLYLLRSWFDQIIGIRTYARENMSRVHRFGNIIINLLFNVLLSASVSDVCSGMYLLRTDFARKLDTHSSGFSIEVETAAKTIPLGRLGEVTISYRNRIGESKISIWKHGFSIVMLILKIWWERLWKKSE